MGKIGMLEQWLTGVVMVTGVGLALGWPAEAAAYAGLGPLLPLIGNGLILLFTVVVTLFGFLAYPILMWRNKRSQKKPSIPSGGSEAAKSDDNTAPPQSS